MRVFIIIYSSFALSNNLKGLWEHFSNVKIQLSNVKFHSSQYSIGIRGPSYTRSIERKVRIFIKTYFEVLKEKDLPQIIPLVLKDIKAYEIKYQKEIKKLKYKTDVEKKLIKKIISFIWEKVKESESYDSLDKNLSRFNLSKVLMNIDHLLDSDSKSFNSIKEKEQYQYKLFETFYLIDNHNQELSPYYHLFLEKNKLINKKIELVTSDLSTDLLKEDNFKKEILENKRDNFRRKYLIHKSISSLLNLSTELFSKKDRELPNYYYLTTVIDIINNRLSFLPSFFKSDYDYLQSMPIEYELDYYYLTNLIEVLTSFYDHYKKQLKKLKGSSDFEKDLVSFTQKKLDILKVNMEKIHSHLWKVRKYFQNLSKNKDANVGILNNITRRINSWCIEKVPVAQIIINYSESLGLNND